MNEEMDEEKDVDEANESYSYSGVSRSAMSTSVGTDASSSHHPRTNSTKNKPTTTTTTSAVVHSNKPGVVVKGKTGGTGGLQGTVKAGPKATTSPAKSHVLGRGLGHGVGEIGEGLLRPNDSSDSFSSSREGLGLDNHWRQGANHHRNHHNSPQNRKHHASSIPTSSTAIHANMSRDHMLLRGSIQDHLHNQDRTGLGLGLGTRVVSRLAASVDSPLGIRLHTLSI